MNEISDLLKDAAGEVIKSSLRETLRQSMKMLQDVFVKTEDLTKLTPSDAVEVMLANLGQLTIARDLLTDLITAVVNIQKDKITSDAAESVMQAMGKEEEKK